MIGPRYCLSAAEALFIGGRRKTTSFWVGYKPLDIGF
jgi:hypothetical protein